ncbi:MAG: hypothetical protein M3416_09220 [Acidobacteriota bacterium]|nr:hypothetical protein [Acidobacteriota bacterium]
MRLTRTVICAALLMFLSAAAAAAQEKPEQRLSSLLGGRVTFTLPQSWVLQSHVDTKTSGRAQIAIPNPPADKSPQRANAILTAKVVPANVNVRQESDGVYHNLYEGLAVLSDTFDGDDWRTMVWTVKDVVPHVVLNRFGLVNRVSVELVVVFPSENNDPKWVEKTLADFNAMSASLKIDGQNRFNSQLKTENLSKPQKANPKP